MTYEEFLDEVTTLLTEIYDLDDEAAIKLVVDAQAAELFSKHDDLPAMCTQDQAKLDAVMLFEQKQNKQRTQEGLPALVLETLPLDDKATFALLKKSNTTASLASVPNCNMRPSSVVGLGKLKSPSSPSKSSLISLLAVSLLPTSL